MFIQIEHNITTIIEKSITININHHLHSSNFLWAYCSIIYELSQFELCLNFYSLTLPLHFFFPSHVHEIVKITKSSPHSHIQQSPQMLVLYAACTLLILMQMITDPQKLNQSHLKSWLHTAIVHIVYIGRDFPCVSISVISILHLELFLLYTSSSLKNFSMLPFFLNSLPPEKF